MSARTEGAGFVFRTGYYYGSGGTVKGGACRAVASVQNPPCSAPTAENVTAITKEAITVRASPAFAMSLMLK